MGCSTSKPSEDEAGPGEAIERQPTVKFSNADTPHHTRVKRDSVHKEGGPLAGMALKFGHVRKAYANLKKVYDKTAQGEEVSATQLSSILRELGNHDISDDECKRIFNLADLDHDKGISFKEFVVAVGIGVYLNPEAHGPYTAEPEFQSTHKGFQVVKEAFEAIDTDHGGTIDLDEFKAALFAQGEGGGLDGNKKIMEARFRELDFDNSRSIDFPEFIYGFTKWVGMDDEEDEEAHQAAVTFQETKAPSGKRSSVKKDGGPLAGMALKFGHVRKAYANLKKVYDQTAQGGEVTAAQLKTMLQTLGNSDITDDECKRIFNLADLDHSQAISFKEYIVAVGLGVYLNEDAHGPYAEEPEFKSTQKGFQVVKEAFHKIDTDGGGTIDLDEFKHALFAQGEGMMGDNQELMEQRFAEMDFDDSKAIDFPEFIYGFTSWVGVDEDEDDE